MNKLIYSLVLIVVLSTSCEDNDVSVFEKSADERTAEAIANLKNELTDPPHGWRIKYKPVEETGSYYVLMEFHDDNKVTIKTDLGAENGKYQEQTIGYRIDNSLGLELVLENYSFFSFLFEQDQAAFGAEYEFNFVNKTPDNALVFSSKTDLSTPTVLLFEPAAANDENLLGGSVGINLSTQSEDLNRFSSSLKLTYLNKDLILYVSIDDVKRVITFNMASKKTNIASAQSINIKTGYHLEGNTLIMEGPVTSTISGSTVRIERITFTSLNESTLNVCTDPFTIHAYSARVGSDDVLLETTMSDLPGGTFAIPGSFYAAPLGNIRHNRLPLVETITDDIAGALQMQLYYGVELEEGGILYGIGFVIRNDDGSITYALREFTPVVTGNNIVFNFAPDFTLLENPNTTANVENINIYLDALTQGNHTYVFKYDTDIYEFHNPCSDWSVVFFKGN